MGVVCAADRSNIFKLVVGMFNAAPGASYLAEFSDVFVAMGRDYGALALALGKTAPFKALYPEKMNAAAFANKFLATLGLKTNLEAQDWVKFQLSTGKSHAQVMLEALVAIVETKDPAFAQAQKLLANKALVAEFFSVDKKQSSESMEHLQAVISKVTAQSDAAQSAAKPNSEFDWTIRMFEGANEYFANSQNKTVLDVRALHVHGLEDLSMLQSGSDAVLRGKEGQNFKIVLVGMSLDDLSAENFIFAA